MPPTTCGTVPTPPGPSEEAAVADPPGPGQRAYAAYYAAYPVVRAQVQPLVERLLTEAAALAQEMAQDTASAVCYGAQGGRDRATALASDFADQWDTIWGHWAARHLHAFVGAVLEGGAGAPANVTAFPARPAPAPGPCADEEGAE